MSILHLVKYIILRPIAQKVGHISFVLFSSLFAGEQQRFLCDGVVYSKCDDDGLENGFNCAEKERK